jgi:hypothetical protein
MWANAGKWFMGMGGSFSSRSWDSVQCDYKMSFFISAGSRSSSATGSAYTRGARLFVRRPDVRRATDLRIAARVAALFGEVVISRIEHGALRQGPDGSRSFPVTFYGTIVGVPFALTSRLTVNKEGEAFGLDRADSLSLGGSPEDPSGRQAVAIMESGAFADARDDAARSVVG